MCDRKDDDIQDICFKHFKVSLEDGSLPCVNIPEFRNNLVIVKDLPHKVVKTSNPISGKNTEKSLVNKQKKEYTPFMCQEHKKKTTINNKMSKINAEDMSIYSDFYTCALSFSENGVVNCPVCYSHDIILKLNFKNGRYRCQANSVHEDTIFGKQSFLRKNRTFMVSKK